MSIVASPLEVFYSFATADEPLRAELDKHLSILRHEKLITTWHAREVGAGLDTSKALDSHLNSASVILLLVSADFLASNYCYGLEVKRVMERHAANPDRVRVIPILLRPVDGWQRAPFGQLQPLPDNGEPVMNWPNRDEAFKHVARGIRAVLEDLQRLAVETPAANLPSIWEVPHPRNPLFTGREETLQRLAETLKPGQPAALAQPQAISGLGGIGKTQLALEYAYRFRTHYQAIFWTLADTRESLISGYVAIARRLNLPQQDAQDQMLTVQATLRWLVTNADWLLILDNADDLAIVREFLPTASSGHILLTTRAQSTGRLATRIEVNTMSQHTGTLFLLRRAAILPAPDASLEQATLEDITIAREIYTELGGLPLALDQAGAYIEETQSSLSHYLKLYRTRRTALLKYHSDLVNDHPRPVATTWSLAFEKVEQKSAVAADLLRLCAFLQPDAIPEEIITQGTAQLDSPLSSFATDPMLLDKAIAVLGAYSLISRDTKDNTLSIHRLVQAVLKDSMDKEVQNEWSLRVVEILNAVFPEVEFATWQRCERYLTQALACAEMIEQGDIMSLDAASLLNKVAWYLYDRARYEAAEPLYKRALGIREQQLGEEHPKAAESLDNLAELYRAQGKYEEAEPLYKRALGIKEQQLGGEHLSTARSLNNLALLYYGQGRYEEAEPLLKRALEIYEQQLGGEHPATAKSLNNLAGLYRAQGKYEEAEPLLKRALGIREQQLGGEHPDTATSLNDLALLYRAQGKYEEAEPLYKRALEIYEQQLGREHPDTATSLNNLAGLYYGLGRIEEAELLFRRALVIREQALGPEHPDTATGLFWLALIHQRRQQYEQARPLYERALAIYERVLGSRHPNTISLCRFYESLLQAIEGEMDEER